MAAEATVGEQAAAVVARVALLARDVGAALPVMAAGAKEQVPRAWEVAASVGVKAEAARAADK